MNLEESRILLSIYPHLLIPFVIIIAKFWQWMLRISKPHLAVTFTFPTCKKYIINMNNSCIINPQHNLSEKFYTSAWNTNSKKYIINMNNSCIINPQHNLSEKFYTSAWNTNSKKLECIDHSERNKICMYYTLKRYNKQPEQKLTALFKFCEKKLI